jgi:SAM-dependent methyltransferase
MIIKIFRKEGSGHFGQDIASWTKLWDSQGILESARDAEKDRYSQFFRRYFPSAPGKILEGGCGTGGYVIAYRKLGYDIIGVDFSVDTIRRIKKEAGQDVPLYAANVLALPFKDDVFDSYVSGGVMEHFEEGPDKALQEARRVLKKGGILLATVPYLNLIRRIYFFLFSAPLSATAFRKDSFPLIQTGSAFLQKRCIRCGRDPDPPAGYPFYQYVFDIHSLAPYFETSGFLVEAAYPMELSSGEIGILFDKLMRKIKAYRGTHSCNTDYAADALRGNAKTKSLPRRLFHDFFTIENRQNLFFRLPLELLSYLSGHLVLIVARAT